MNNVAMPENPPCTPAMKLLQDAPSVVLSEAFLVNMSDTASQRQRTSNALNISVNTFDM